MTVSAGRFRVMKKGDRAMLLLCAAMLLFSAVFFIYRGSVPPRGQRTAIVMINGEVVDTLRFGEDTEPFERVYKAGNGFNIIRADNGLISVVSADCHDALCVKKGPLGGNGESSVCLPHRFMVRVTGGDAADDEIDGGTY